MKVLKFKGKFSIRKRIIIILSSLIIIAGIATVIVYVTNEGAREWININILNKEVTEEDVATIKIDADKTQFVYAYDKYITILCNGKLEGYNSYASKVYELDVQISNPIFKANGNYLAIAENSGQKIYLIEDGKVLWDSKVEGNISRMDINKNGKISIITRGTSYKSVITTFDKNGKELFKTYLASTIAVATQISVDGKYLAIAEVNTSGALVESGIKIIDIEKASKGDTTNSVIFKYSAEKNKLITDIKYQEKGQLVCIYEDSIHMIYQDQDMMINQFNSNVQISDINLKGHTVRTEEAKTGLSSVKTNVILTNINNNAESVYIIESVIKKLTCYDQIIAANLGTEVHFINLNGWLQKRYTSVQEIKDIVIGNSIAGVIYRDRIKIISL